MVRTRLAEFPVVFQQVSADALLFGFRGIALVATMALLGHGWKERDRLREWVHGLRVGGRDASTEALSLAGVLHRHIPRNVDDPPFLSPALASLGATPMEVVRQGGCCSGVTRLYILSLQAIGIRAWQVTVCRSNDEAVHCLAEVDLGSHRHIIDPSYGFAFHDAGGLPIGLEDLRRGLAPQFIPLPGCDETGYPDNTYYAFDYSRTKTANWTCSSLRRFTYRALRSLTGEAIDVVRVPRFMEWPQALLAGMIGVTAITIDLLIALLR